ncbi:MAG TPA: hypothetical protein VFV03_09470 [Solirubrobacteraceae bacterium]|nr:hypothetical protein [Solirubrobacteraceae bacterium]
MTGRPALLRPSARTRLLASLALCILALSACGDTLQDQPIGPAPLETVIVKSRFPVYWLGMSFHGMRITGVTIDPGGAVTIRYGDCLIGGQYTCVAPLSIVSSPDNSFVPGGPGSTRSPRLRGASASSASDGAALAIPTGGVVVSVYARHPALAAAAAAIMAPVNKVGLPQEPLPAAVPDTGFDRVPLPSEIPPGASIPSTPGR